MALAESLQMTSVSVVPFNGMENSTSSQRSNHVSSVLLYGVPIVSLFIEGQERLCLAQISNTLLKQFSYNEIHNRRVALGITCVQCTPVQLEILRRAGAMPVSSRRCGMITRREAERLCKSFLGDNTPPRLPDDFAFNVQHKCAWGCRGSFLPSRYNSSRAKCIKCSYCGMFFSPNKFIFHSHRITTNDRYVQPDAANFNSWRRHMTLSGNTYDEKIIHAWEDVKAMFNGGTRKRLVGSSINNRNMGSPTPSAAVSSCGSPTSIERDPKEGDGESESPEFPQRQIDSQFNYSTVATAAAVVGVTAVAAATVGVPFNLHGSTVLSPLHSLRNDRDLSLMPISRNFVVDYMWQQKDGHYQHQYSKKLSGGEPSEQSLDFESCSRSWTRPDTNVSIPTGSSLRLSDNTPFNIKNESHSSICGIIKNRKLSAATSSGLSLSDYNIPSILNCSAFKPVVASTAIVSTSLYTRSSDSKRTDYINPTQSTRTTTVLTHNSISGSSHQIVGETISPILEKVTPNIEKKPTESALVNCLPRNVNDTDDDDEVVDIETTEDEGKFMAQHVDASRTPPDIVFESESTSPSPSTSTNIDVEADIDVDVITTDAEDQLEFNASRCAIENTSHSLSVFQSETLRMCGSSPNAKIMLGDNEVTISENTKGFNAHLRTKARRKNEKNQQDRSLSKNTVSKLVSDKSHSKSLAAKEISSSMEIQQRVAFPVFLKSHLHAFRPQPSRPATFSPNTLAESNKWNYPVGSSGTLCCYETSANEKCLDFK
ncbi:uncharacterized protein LOC108035667 [Drosophila biarmipes]|uniref:uncharacterized protein LOC108035667 n=1 Tax=Drosophila biarmipes TaxID=125945 RepID=UPI0007E68D8B|nr:uncharacterized protein LOC108035667 [Drosophila biarmipes]XP_043947225.1 uncharacterized protein LOC108035667 [Drosophila biarmipes]XP_050742884.1 uncharacterized protein LOC108035667 [Drosophila biarmipes]XP_050742885.1 uncharacterized protein LOC108035667 [Drosophila biarmipes]XP_050742886.1 uncharacterized protein LOC108035667 [Drosophila biarmipes]XP_050742887.1 uncharacterized protein LOC108035667 [Drosophila biarmipes]